MADIAYENYRAPQIARSTFRGARGPEQSSPYRDTKSIEEAAMIKGSDVVTWTQFGIFVMVAVAVIGGGFLTLHSDIVDVKSDLKDVRTELHSTRGEVVSAIGETNKRLDALLEQGRRR